MAAGPSRSARATSSPVATPAGVKTMPASSAMRQAVFGSSPVTITTPMPAARQAAIAAGTSGLIGSSMPTRPRNSRSTS